MFFFGATKSESEEEEQDKTVNLYFMRGTKNGSWTDVRMLKSRWLSPDEKKFSETCFEIL